GMVGRFGGSCAGLVVAALNAASAASRELVVLRVLSAGISVLDRALSENWLRVIMKRITLEKNHQDLATSDFPAKRTSRANLGTSVQHHPRQAADGSSSRLDRHAKTIFLSNRPNQRHTREREPETDR